MIVDSVPVRFSPGFMGVLHLREIRGRDELSVIPGTPGALRLLDGLLTDAFGMALDPGQAAKLTTPDRDRLLAAVYQNTYGDRIESTLRCRQCEEPFDLDFKISDLLDHHRPEEVSPVAESLEDGSFRLPDGRRFRLPTGADECAIIGLTPPEAQKALIQRCLLEGDPDRDWESLQRAMEAVAPVLSTDMTATCPECGHEQTAHFDVQHYLLTTLQEEKPLIALEVHRLARAYHWSQREILDLPRGLRKTYVGLIESELEALSL